ncbi:hypothetical protein NXY55_24200, partial [Aeromonas veronii]|nr:hypothetical protein [Aeromonas veronii]
KFDVLKNKIQIERFSGETKQTIEQEFYASLFLSNMASLLKHESDVIITEEHKDKDFITSEFGFSKSGCSGNQFNVDPRFSKF